MFDMNNICCHAAGEDRGCVVCCYGGVPERTSKEFCGEDTCEWFEKQSQDTKENK